MRREDEAPELDDGDRALIDELRTLPPEGDEPEWSMLEAKIRAAVGHAAPRPWWRNWKWVVPVWALATTAAVVLVVVREPEHDTIEQPQAVVPRVHEDAGVEEVRAAANTMWLDGEPLELDEIEVDALDELERDVRVEIAEDETDEADGILPVADYGWVDTLDEAELERAEQWLARKRS